MKKLLSRRFVFLLSLLSAIFFFVILFQLQMLPLKYFVSLIIIILLVLIILFKAEKDKKGEHPIKVTIYKLLQIILSVVMVVSSLYLMKGSDFLASITGGQDETIEMDIIVLKSSAYQTLEDLTDKNFGANTVDTVNINKTEALIEDEIGDIQVEYFDSYSEVISALHQGSIDAMIVKAVDLESLNDIEVDFEENIRIIKTFEIKLPSVKANSAKVTKEPFNILISGRDKKGPISTFSLSDVNMIATVNPTTKQILLTSIPRDYYVEMIGIDGVSGKDKLTHSAKGGIDATIQTIESLMGIKINYYAKFNFTSFMNVVDALGGITVNVPKYDVIGRDDGVFTTRLDKITIEPGEQTFDSKTALSFVRERYAFVKGDEIRGKNQMIMLKAIIKKCCSPAIISKMDAIFESLSDSFETNLEASDIKSLINMQIDDMASWDVQSYRLDGDASHRVFELATVGDVSKVNSKGVYVTEPYEESIQQAYQYIEAVMNNEIVKVEE